MPNLNAGRGLGLAGFGECLNVRRLMYQTLIWPAVLGDQARRLRAALDAKDLQRLADALVDGVRRNVELGGDFLGAEVLVDKPEAIELGGGKPGDTRGRWPGVVVGAVVGAVAVVVTEFLTGRVRWAWRRRTRRSG